MTRSRRRSCCVVLGWLTLLGLVSSLRAADPAPPTTQPTIMDSSKRVEAAVKLLVDETAKWGAGSDALLTYTRPHPAVAGLGPKDANQCLILMVRPMTGDPMRDTYIRYHLMWVVLQSLDEAKQNEVNFGNLLEMIKLIPEEIKFEVKPMARWEPKDLGERYQGLVNSTVITIGFPPFQRQVGAPESFQYMDAPTRAKAEANWAEAQTLKDKVKYVVDQPNSAWNHRGWWCQHMLRQVRGEILLGMIASGDTRLLEMSAKATAETIKTKPGLASDFLTFFNSAYLNGWLAQYDHAKLKRVGDALKEAIVANNAAAQQQWINVGRYRNLAETVYTLIMGIDRERLPNRPKEGEQTRKFKTLPPLAASRPAVDPAKLELAQVEVAIERAIQVLIRMQAPDEDFGQLSYAAAGLPHGWADLIQPGQQALATWSILTAGESPQTWWMQKRINWAACFDTPSTYDRAMRLQMFSELPKQEWKEWVRRDVMTILQGMTEQGNFNSNWLGEKPEGFGDNANGQYAALGLWAAMRTDYPVPTEAWQRIDQYWRRAQFPARKDAAGWAVTSYASLNAGDNANAFANRVNAPMTAGGVLSLSISERYLLGPKRLETGNKISTELARGIRWLDENFSFDAKGEGDSDFYYYMWTIQNVGQATGYRTFNKVDWFREGTARLLNEQNPDGLWTGPKGPVVSTSFALLYLNRARGPLAVCKLRFLPSNLKEREKDEEFIAWNNRPNDLVNFTDWVTEQLEVTTSWQIADLDQPVYELIESPILYLATDKYITLDDKQAAKLKAYIDAGGMLVCIPEGRSLEAPMKGFKQLAKQMYPSLDLKRVDGKRPFYDLVNKVPPTIPISAVENEVRPLVMVVEKDLSRDLQANGAKGYDAFQLLENIYLYATGRDAKHPRLLTNYVLPRPVLTAAAGPKLVAPTANTPTATGAATAPSATTAPATQPAPVPQVIVKAARIQFEGSFDPEPMALPSIVAMLGNNFSVDMRVNTLKPSALTDEKIAFLTFVGDAKLSDDETAALRKWLDNGGTLWVDAAGGQGGAILAMDQFTNQLGFKAGDFKALGDSFVATGEGVRGNGMGGFDNKQATFRRYTSGAGDVRRTAIQVASIEDRPAVYAARTDLTAGLAGLNHWAIAGYTPEAARHLVINGVLDVLPAPPKPATVPTATTAPTATTQPATLPTTQPAVAPAEPPAVVPAPEPVDPKKRPMEVPTTYPS